MTLGIAGFGAVMQALFPKYSKVWEITKPEAKAGGEATETWVESRPIDQRPIKLLKALPTINLLGTFAVILAPRFKFMITTAIAQRKRGPPAPLSVWEPQPPATTSSNGEAAAAAPTPQGREDSIAGAGYAGEVNGSFETIDGTAVE